MAPKQVLVRIAALEKMIESGVDRMVGDSWHKDEWYLSVAGDYIASKQVWDELSDFKGQLNYHGRIFFVVHNSARRGMGGMDEGSPESITVYRIHV